MSLFPKENMLTREIESWKVFGDSLKSDEDNKLFFEMLERELSRVLYGSKLELTLSTQPECLNRFIY